MTEEEAIDILKNSIADYVIGDYCEKCADNKICEDRNEDCYYIQAIDIILNLIQKQDTEINKLNKKIKQLKEDISNMYDEKVVRNILEDYCDLSKDEIEELLN